jgi:hypothetical protein
VKKNTDSITSWLANDTTNAPSGIGNPTGPVRIVQAITLSPDGQHYTGTFTLRALGLSGNQIAKRDGQEALMFEVNESGDSPRLLLSRLFRLGRAPGPSNVDIVDYVDYH